MCHVISREIEHIQNILMSEDLIVFCHFSYTKIFSLSEKCKIKMIIWKLAVYC